MSDPEREFRDEILKCPVVRWMVLSSCLLWLAIFFCLGWLCGSCHGGEQPSVEATVEAIWICEGTTNAVPPYGIMALRAEWLAATPEQRPAVQAKCRRWCENTVRNNLKRWTDAGRPGCFILWLGRVYCPEIADPVGHRNWMRNMKSRLRHVVCDCRGKEK